MGMNLGIQKKFGGIHGTDPDYLKLIIHGISSQGDTTGVVEFYLADFRFDNSLMDYIIDEWTSVDLSALGEVEEIHFSMESTDVGPWGMNTPAYFCVDDVNGEAPVGPADGKTIAGMEDLAIAPEGYDDGADMAGGFESGDFHFTNNYNADWFSWSGFAASASTDADTKGWANQFSSIAGSGALGTQTYAVGYDFGDMDVVFSPQLVDGVYVVNNAYTYWSMKDGDAYAKKFGGIDGDDPDWLMLTVEGFDAQQNSTGTVQFYLADFRFEDNSKDYIVDTWKYVDLSPLGEVAKLHFSLSSSDTGAWGMNTPTYFCLDELNYDNLAPVVINPIADIGHLDNPDRVFYIPIDSVFTDPDDPDSLMVYSIEGIDNPALVSASIVRMGTVESKIPHVVINVTRGMTGEAVVTLGATSNGQTSLHQFKIVVNFPTNANLPFEAEMKVYPNPFVDQLFISLPNTQGRALLFDANGRLFADKELQNHSTTVLDGLSQLKAGIYILTIDTPVGKISKKIIKK